MPHAMYFTGDSNTVTKINQVPYQTIEYNDNGMFTTKLMNDTPIKIYIDNLYSSEDRASSFTDDTDTHCNYSISNHTPDIENANDTPIISHQNTPPYIHKENTHTETLLEMYTYSITILIIKIYSHFKTNIQHHYSKNFKTHTGIYMTQ